MENLENSHDGLLKQRLKTVLINKPGSFSPQLHSRFTARFLTTLPTPTQKGSVFSSVKTGSGLDALVDGSRIPYIASLGADAISPHVAFLVRAILCDPEVTRQHADISSSVDDLREHVDPSCAMG